MTFKLLTFILMIMTPMIANADCGYATYDISIDEVISIDEDFSDFCNAVGSAAAGWAVIEQGYSTEDAVALGELVTQVCELWSGEWVLDMF